MQHRNAFLAHCPDGPYFVLQDFRSLSLLVSCFTRWAIAEGCHHCKRFTSATGFSSPTLRLSTRPRQIHAPLSHCRTMQGVIFDDPPTVFGVQKITQLEKVIFREFDG